MGLFEDTLEQGTIKAYVKLVIVFIIGLLIYSLMKQFIYWLTFSSGYRATYKVITIIILMVVLRFF